MFTTSPLYSCKADAWSVRGSKGATPIDDGAGITSMNAAEEAISSVNAPAVISWALEDPFYIDVRFDLEQSKPC